MLKKISAFLFAALASSTAVFAAAEDAEAGTKAIKDVGKVLSEGAMVMCIGLIVVFAVLIFLWLFLELLGMIFNKVIPPKAEKGNIGLDAPEVVINEMPVNDDTELVAVISAAAAAYLQKEIKGDFIIRSIKKRG